MLAWINRISDHFARKVGIEILRKALALLVHLASEMGSGCWDYHRGEEDFAGIMAKLSADFAAVTDQSKFELCQNIAVVLRSWPRRAIQV